MSHLNTYRGKNDYENQNEYCTRTLARIIDEQQKLNELFKLGESLPYIETDILPV